MGSDNRQSCSQHHWVGESIKMEVENTENDTVVELIPADVKVAAKRGFLRTTAQAYATSMAGGISATAIISLLSNSEPWLPILVTWVVALVTPLLSGLASYFSILSRGIPADYQPEETVVEPPSDVAGY